MTMDPMATTVAGDEPDSAANNMQANTPAMASSAASAGVGMKAAAAVASQRVDTGLREIGGPGLRKSSSLPAGRKGKGD